MTRAKPADTKPMQAIRKLALRLPEVEESVVCSKAAFKARGKGFLFMGMDESSWNLLLKLGPSLPEAAKLAAKEPQHYGVGGRDWVSVTFPHTASPPPGLMEHWIDESFRLLAPKKLVAALPAAKAW